MKKRLECMVEEDMYEILRKLSFERNESIGKICRTALYEYFTKLNIEVDLSFS